MAQVGRYKKVPVFYRLPNNEAERRLRSYKRKQAQAVTFRSFKSIDYLCQCMSMFVLMRLEEPANNWTECPGYSDKKTDGFDNY